LNVSPTIAIAGIKQFSISLIYLNRTREAFDSIEPNQADQITGGKFVTYMTAQKILSEDELARLVAHVGLEADLLQPEAAITYPQFQALLGALHNNRAQLEMSDLETTGDPVLAVVALDSSANSGVQRSILA
jgi:Ca2+-binding EF-hand superfamily protein